MVGAGQLRLDDGWATAHSTFRLMQMFQVIASLYVYIWIIEHSGKLTIRWIDTIYQLSMVICSAIVQFLFILRLYRLSGSIWLPTLIVFLTLGQFGTGVVLFVKANFTHGPQSILFSKRPLTVSWLTLEAVADLVIGFAMSYFLQKRRTGFRRMDTVLRKLTAYAISTGLLTGILALGAMFSVAFHSPQFIPMIFIFVLGGVYTTSLLANLHSRSRLWSELRFEGDNGISIHLSRLPSRHVEGHHSNEGTDQAQ
ncbi:uncharacterized protein EI90DRAFT_421946 [Cantharellus anzutake]|uniref:uncharacterized protein n=1 Tax=Cantharellus anzutake TaxID=1750568 RepID=UPI001903983B|nr:uncharacterized protein EI90DRAFT_421946 [Cantharellus anzutake]KAF8314618.1 hypothetical protein EI90DRAFT_421946 [Cantharellus anzutake]